MKMKTTTKNMIYLFFKDIHTFVLCDGKYSSSRQ